MASRPEQLAPPEVFYNDAEARKYTTSSRMIEIQALGRRYLRKGTTGWGLFPHSPSPAHFPPSPARFPPIPCSLSPIPCSLSPIPCSLPPIPCSLSPHPLLAFPHPLLAFPHPLLAFPHPLLAFPPSPARFPPSPARFPPSPAHFPPSPARFPAPPGCGSGLSGEALSEAGHHWVGLDISPAMLDVAAERAVDGDLMLSDMGQVRCGAGAMWGRCDVGQGLPLRNAVFDGAISISAVQWLCNADKSSHNPRLRLKDFFQAFFQSLYRSLARGGRAALLPRAFFQSLYRSLARGGRAALQIYPNGAPQLEMISKAAMQAGFSGGLVVDYPHSTRAKKYFLCLVAGPAGSRPMPKGKGGDGESEESEDEDGSDESDGEGRTVGYEQRQRQRPGKKQKLNGKGAKGRNWVLKKKEHRRQRGDMDVPRDTKYTARKRKSRF
ncbi:unnamed protein product [Closterium sp. NIES-64]|nr:unnamed protein product [Closterium sp. NIES-64]